MIQETESWIYRHGFQKTMVDLGYRPHWNKLRHLVGDETELSLCDLPQSAKAIYGKDIFSAAPYERSRAESNAWRVLSTLMEINDSGYVVRSSRSAKLRGKPLTPESCHVLIEYKEQLLETGHDGSNCQKQHTGHPPFPGSSLFSSYLTEQFSHFIEYKVNVCGYVPDSFLQPLRLFDAYCCGHPQDHVHLKPETVLGYADSLHVKNATRPGGKAFVKKIGNQINGRIVALGLVISFIEAIVLIRLGCSDSFACSQIRFSSFLYVTLICELPVIVRPKLKQLAKSV